MRKWLPRLSFVVLIAITILLVGWAALLRSMVRWIPERLDVRLEPSRPILTIEDIDPESAVGLLLRACNEAGSIDYDREAIGEESERLLWEPWTDDAFPAHRALLEQAGPALDLARRSAARTDAQVPTVLSIRETHPYSSVCRHRITPWLEVSAFRRTATGDLEGAMRDLLAAIRIGDHLTRGGETLHLVLATAIGQRACARIRRIALARELPDSVVEFAAERLAATDQDLEPFVEAVRHDWLINDALVNDIYEADPAALSSWLGESSLIRLRRFWPLLGLRPDRTRETVAAIYSHLVAGSIRGDPGQSLESAVASSALRSGGDRWREDEIALCICPEVHVSGMWERIHDRWKGHRACLRGTRLVLAIARFERAEQRLPALLSEMAPDYIEAVPADPFDGEPFRYRVDDDGTWRVYSVGPDGIDDGGEAPARRVRPFSAQAMRSGFPGAPGSSGGWSPMETEEVTLPREPAAWHRGVSGDIVFPSDEAGWWRERSEFNRDLADRGLMVPH